MSFVGEIAELGSKDLARVLNNALSRTFLRTERSRLALIAAVEGMATHIILKSIYEKMPEREDCITRNYD